VVAADGTRHSPSPVAASIEEGEALRAWTVREGATRTVEVSLGYGASALFVSRDCSRPPGGTGAAS
jgi:hypothetical protein